MARRFHTARNACFLTAFLLFAGFGFDAAGSSPPDEEATLIGLPEVVAHGELGTTSKQRVLALGTPSPTQAQLKEPTGFISAVERSAGASTTPAELAARSAGIAIRDQGHNQPVSISLRGSSSEQVTVVLDGLPLNGLAGGGFDLTTLPANFVRRLSVVRGALGARYGSGTLGGAVDVELIEPPRGERRVFGELGYGSFLTFDGSLGSALDFEKTSVLLSAYARSSRGDYPYLYDPKPLVDGNALIERRRENNASQRYGVLARVHRDDPVRLDLLLEADGGIRGVPGTVQAPTHSAEQRDARAFLLAKASGNALGMELEGRLGARLGLLQWSPDRNDPERWQHEHHAFTEISAKKFFDLHAVDVGLRLGHEGLRGPSHGEHDRLLAALFAGAELEFDHLTILPALRGEFVGRRFGLSPKLGLSLSMTKEIELRANVGRSFRAPSFGELYLEQGSISPNPELTSETALFVDAGVAAQFSPIAKTPLYLRSVASGFVTRYGDVILYELYAPMRIKPYNLGMALVWGFEFELEAALVLEKATLRITSAYTLSFSENQSGDSRYDGRELPFHPRHRVSGLAEITVWRLSVHFGSEFQSLQQLNRSNTDVIAGRTRCEAGMSVNLHPSSGLKLTVELKNLFDVQGQDLYGYPLTGRHFHLSLGFDADFTPRKKITQ